MGKYLKFFNNIKKNMTKYGSKKLIEKALIIAIIGVICLIAGSVLFEGNTLKGSTPVVQGNITGGADGAVETAGQQSGKYEDELAKNMESILSQIKGAGKVEVMITYYSGNESVPAYDVKSSGSDTQERDKEGGTRSAKQSDNESTVIYQEEQGVKKPFIAKELLPRVKGVVIVADGAGDVEVKSSLAVATEALLDVAAHKIQVFQRNGN